MTVVEELVHLIIKHGEDIINKRAGVYVGDDGKYRVVRGLQSPL